MENGIQYKIENSQGIRVYLGGWYTSYRLVVYVNDEIMNIGTVKESYEENYSDIGTVKSITMGGIDITNSSYNEETKIVNIPNINGDIEIRLDYDLQ